MSTRCIDGNVDVRNMVGSAVKDSQNSMTRRGTENVYSQDPHIQFNFPEGYMVTPFSEIDRSADLEAFYNIGRGSEEAEGPGIQLYYRGLGTGENLETVAEERVDVLKQGYNTLLSNTHAGLSFMKPENYPEITKKNTTIGGCEAVILEHGLKTGYTSVLNDLSYNDIFVINNGRVFTLHYTVKSKDKGKYEDVYNTITKNISFK